MILMIMMKVVKNNRGLTELRFNVPFGTKYVILEMLFIANHLESNLKPGEKQHNNAINPG